MKNKKWLRSVAFILLLAMAVIGVSQCYGLPNSYDKRNLAAFDNEKEGTIDGLVFGTSVVGYSWNTPAAWRDYGMGIYHMGTSVQPFRVIEPFIDYALKKHDIKYAVVDIHGLRSEAILTSLRDEKVRSAYYNFPNFFGRFSVLDTIFEYAQDAFAFYGEPTKGRDKYVDINDKSFFFPLYTFHSRWAEEPLVKADYIAPVNKYMGADDRKKTFDVEDCSGYIDVWNFSDPGDIDQFQKNELERLFAYGKEKGIELLFISLPSFRPVEEQKEMSAILDYCEERGYDTLDFSDMDVIEQAGINLKEDFFDEGHLNARGGIKSTKYICEFLKENGYYTPDHRGEELYSSWDDATERYFKFYNERWNSKESE